MQPQAAAHLTEDGTKQYGACTLPGRATGIQKPCGDGDFGVKMLFWDNSVIRFLLMCCVVRLQHLSKCCCAAGVCFFVVSDMEVCGKDHPLQPIWSFMLPARQYGKQNSSILKGMCAAKCIKEENRWRIWEQSLENSCGCMVKNKWILLKVSNFKAEVTDLGLVQKLIWDLQK